jgi:phosphoglycerol transferase MdoB-like AlkP superfamily enzyme
MKSISQKNKQFQYGFLNLTLLVSFWLISTFELYSKNVSRLEIIDFCTTLIYKFVNDIWTVLIIGILFYPIYFLVHKKRNKWEFNFLKFLYILIVFIQFVLVKYSLTTLLNLGADILGYSINDMFLTVKSSESFSIMSFLPLLLFPLVFLLLYILFRNRVKKKIAVVFLISIVLVSGFFSFLNTEVLSKKHQNKLSFLVIDVIKFKIKKNKLSSDFKERNDYPYLKPFKETKDVLSPFFTIRKEKPNVVIIVLEGLGGEFVGDNDYAGFTPYLDSLISKSLYWPNFLSTTGRSFGVLPSLLGSLPYGEKGFLELKELPSHISLINVLKGNGYSTSFYAGHQSSFDKKINFLEYNGIDYVVDENNFGKEYEKAKANSEGYSWGYPDAEIYRKALSVFDKRKSPRLDILLTLSNHEPFEFPEKEKYLRHVDRILKSNQKIKADKESVELYKQIYASLLYTDQSLAEFMKGYAVRPDYDNTIFIITGDHRLIPIEQKDQLCRYHVPLFIYSPMLKTVKTFKSISSHLDVTPTLLSFLMNNYNINKLEKTAWLGKGIDTSQSFRNIHEIPFMKYKGMINDFIYKEYMLSDGELFKIKENLGTYKVVNDSLLSLMKKKLTKFKIENAYVTKRNKIFPDSLNTYTISRRKFSKNELKEIQKIIKGLNYDEVFNVAREKAFAKDLVTARLLCAYVLNNLPNHVDARILKGRTLAWDGIYDQAEKEFLRALDRSPYYDDIYLALLDLYWWSDQDKKSEFLVAKALENKITNIEISFKLAKAFKRMNKKDRALKLMDSILKIHSKNVEYLTFKKTLE